MNLKIVGAIVGIGAAFWAGHYVAYLAGVSKLEQANAQFSKERASLAESSAEAIRKQQAAEQSQAKAIQAAAANYEQGKSDAQATADRDLADLRTGNLRLRDQWATCRNTAAVVSAAAAANQPDGQDGLRAASAVRIVRAVEQCQSQRDSLQEALLGERISR